MAFTGSFKCTEGKRCILAGYACVTDVWKIALYTNAASFTAATTGYTATDEISGTGYTAGGATLVKTFAVKSGTTEVYVDFDDVEWASASFTAYGAMIYNDTLPAITAGAATALTRGSTSTTTAPITTAAKPAIAIIDFGGARVVSGGKFTIAWPDPSTSTPIISID